ncbi:MAG: FimV family protein [gamma proteobacterium endosymbiont of Lamellibrachia anaximandri]|nr:FimV family protein [gamma proteobacterium endosymbiont of Lamellibrachia anaximandri]MBL3618456.1 FimV family protein [gamma proteobacterium endosymbiont of Lamellibrachia anaximandri]
MIRKLSLAVAIATALSPLGAYALGLGEIHTQSSLNQYFKADIDLISVKSDEVQDVRVELASQAAFARAGVERPFMLSGLTFKPTLRSDGKVVITVSSRDPVREPFLNFLIEVNWPKGRLIREYTVLLDPPVTVKRKPAPVTAPVVQTAPASTPTPVQSRRPVTPRRQEAAVSRSDGGAREYGPVKNNDNLWVIAKSMRRSGETTEQLMMALLEHNPKAFIRNNVNGLKVGKILRLPEGADPSALSSREARSEFLAQTNAWRENRGRGKAATTDQSPAISAPVPADDRLKLVSAKPEADEAVDREGKAEQKEDLQRLEKQILLVRESNESTRQESEELRGRIKGLEAQLADIQRLLTLKSDQLAQLQSTQLLESQAPEVMAEEEVLPVSDEPVIDEADIESAIDEAMQQAADSAVVAEPVQEAKPELAVIEKPAPVVAPPVTPTRVAEETAPKPIVKKKPKERGLLDALTGNTTLMGIVGAVGVLLLSLLWLIMRRRKEAEAEFAESILVTPDGEPAAEAAQVEAGSINELTDETSFLSDFSPSDIDALQDETGEVDPLSEADVYIAYGRYQQAEELVKQAIEKAPERAELKHKLLEIHYSAKDTSAFTALAGALSAAGIATTNPDVWSRISAMGRELDPENSLFGSAADTAPAEDSFASGMDDELDDLGLNLDSELHDSSLDLSTPAPAAPESVDALDDLDNDLDSLDLSELSDLDDMEPSALDSELSIDIEMAEDAVAQNDAANQTKPDTTDSELLDIDLASLGLDSGLLEDATQSEGLDDSLQLDSSPDTDSVLADLDLGDLADDTGSATSSIIGIDDSESLDDLDLESLERELESLSEDLDAKESEGSDLLGTDSEDLGETDEDIAPHSLTFDEEMELGAEDEVNTKLDLARAYVDMGDEEGARSILEEVATEGNDEQQEEATQLLEKMSS